MDGTDRPAYRGVPTASFLLARVRVRRAMTWIGHFDGACEPYNPGGWGGWGFAIWDPSQTEIASDYGVLPKGRAMTNNVAEYTAALELVKRWIALAITAPLVVRGDSKLVIEQMCRRWQVKSGAYVAVHHELRALVDAHALDATWEWVPRAQNGRADDLSKQGLLAQGVTITVR